MTSDKGLQEAIERAFEAGCAHRAEGDVARYIPELAKVDPSRLALAIATADGDEVARGDANTGFTLQSASKVFALACVLQAGEGDLFDHISVEPSGDAFNSIVKLEAEAGKPRNPYINAGALVVSSRLGGDSAETRMATLIRFFASLGVEVVADEAVCRSEADTGYRNKALANMLRQYHHIPDVERALATYFRQCSLTLNARELARAGGFLANRGVDPRSGKRILEFNDCRRVVALMTTCGMYDEVGVQAVRVGVPTKSAVSGAMIAIVPGRMAIAAYAPALGPKGNSIAGTAMLERLALDLDLSVFG
ncbi:MAG: glutaminase A [Geminicoccaceae bacterium]